MAALEVERVSKRFASTRAVADVSLQVEAGEIFALLGPNGAGKTTLIRMVLGLLRPDEGRIAVLGGPLTQHTRDRIGYLPEDRGLYREMRLLECLAFLGGLKGLSRADARRRAAAYLERFELGPHSKKKIKLLSRGMHQKAQIIAAVLHEPDLLVVDEPFAGLDPVNVELINTVLRERAAAGAAVILLAHEMALVQALAVRMAMISGGERVLYGPIAAIRRAYGASSVLVAGHGSFGPLPGVREIEQRGETLVLHLAPGAAPRAVLHALCAEEGFEVERFELALPTLDEIFVRVARGEPAPEWVAA